MCLNGMLGAEAGGLPAEVLEEIEIYFRRCIDDLSSRIGGPNAAERAFHVMAALEGGLILARAYGDISAFDNATASLTTPALAA
jgi:TetR/AcrR family transcriptional repressor of nem operon